MQGARIRDAVARGDLDGVHEASRALLQLILSTEQPAPQTTLGEVVAVTRRLESVADLPAAARTSAALAERCGACHAAFGGPVSLPAESPPEMTGIEPSMRRHQWGASRLWEGLVAPSNEAWQSGALVLTDAPLASDVPPGASKIPEVETLSASVHEIGQKRARRRAHGRAPSSMHSSSPPVPAVTQSWAVVQPARSSDQLAWRLRGRSKYRTSIFAT